jgi:hypothetical protein
MVATSLAMLSGCAAPSPFVHKPIDAQLYHEPHRNAVTFWGHASVYIDADGVGIVTDPVFESSYSPIHPRKVPRPPTSAYDQTSIVLISHAHSDHLDPPTLRRFPRTAVILCPAPAEKYVRGLGPGGPSDAAGRYVRVSGWDRGRSRGAPSGGAVDRKG